ncbi:MAG: ribbon-helix-helix domain-containing protein [Spirochaetota bacterium]
MAVGKIAITIEQANLVHLDRLVQEKKYPNRSRAIQDAIEGKIRKLERNRLREECEKLIPDEEKRFAEGGFASEKEAWPEY